VFWLRAGGSAGRGAARWSQAWWLAVSPWPRDCVGRTTTERSPSVTMAGPSRAVHKAV